MIDIINDAGRRHHRHARAGQGAGATAVGPESGGFGCMLQMGHDGPIPRRPGAPRNCCRQRSFRTFQGQAQPTLDAAARPAMCARAWPTQMSAIEHMTQKYEAEGRLVQRTAPPARHRRRPVRRSCPAGRVRITRPSIGVCIPRQSSASRHLGERGRRRMRRPRVHAHPPYARAATSALSEDPPATTTGMNRGAELVDPAVAAVGDSVTYAFDGDRRREADVPRAVRS